MVVAGSHVKLGEELGAAQLVQKFLHHWDGKPVFDCGVVEGAVVDAEPPRAVWLENE